MENGFYKDEEKDKEMETRMVMLRKTLEEVERLSHDVLVNAGLKKNYENLISWKKNENGENLNH